MRDVSPDQGGQRRHALEGLTRALAVHRLEVVEAPDAVEAEVLGEANPAHELVPGHALLRDVESEPHVTPSSRVDRVPLGGELGHPAVEAPGGTIVVQDVVVAPDELHGPAALALEQEDHVAGGLRLAVVPLGDERVQDEVALRLAPA